MSVGSVHRCTVMTMESLSLTDARAQLPQLLDRVAAGESFTITRHGASVAVLVGHDAWLKTKTHDVILQARELGRRLDEARGKPLNLPKTRPGPAEVDAVIAELRRSKGPRYGEEER
jgi:prevent-host-death family protein